MARLGYLSRGPRVPSYATGVNAEIHLNLEVDSKPVVRCTPAQTDKQIVNIMPPGACSGGVKL